MDCDCVCVCVVCARVHAYQILCVFKEGHFSSSFCPHSQCFTRWGAVNCHQSQLKHKHDFARPTFRSANIASASSTLGALRMADSNTVSSDSTTLLGKIGPCRQVAMARIASYGVCVYTCGVLMRFSSASVCSVGLVSFHIMWSATPSVPILTAQSTQLL